MAHLVTGKVRLSYEHIWEPASINDSDEKYSVSLIIAKSDTKTVKDIQNASRTGKTRRQSEVRRKNTCKFETSSS